MNLNQIINMIIRTVMRRVINTGINKSMDFVSRKGKSDAEMTEADRNQAQTARGMTKRARDAAKIIRRL